MNPLELYLQRVARELRSMPSAKRDDELRELRSHLEQRAQDFSAQGMDATQAQILALDEFGAPRTLGARLCDAWEGVPFSLNRLLLTIGGVTLFWLGSNALLFGGMALAANQRSEPYPAWQYGVLLSFILGIPFWSGCLFSHWLGRRGPIVSFLCFSALFLLLLAIPNFGISGDISSIPLPVWNTILAVGGALWGQARRKRFQRLALSSGNTLEGGSRVSARWILPTLRLCIAFTTSVALLTASIFYGTRGRRALQPLEIVGTSLRTPYTYSSAEYSIKRYRGAIPPKSLYYYSRDFSIPLLKLRVLPPTTAAERAGQEQRVYFFLEINAQKQHVARRIAFLQQELASPQERQKWGEAKLRATLARVQRNEHKVQGTVRLVQTPVGWQVDENSFDRTKLWSWCNDISFKS